MAITPTKVCSTCKVEKSLFDFTANKSQKTGYMTYCKDCNSIRNQKYRKETATVERACKRVFSYLSRRVKEKKLDLDFDVDYLMYLYHKQQGVCVYTGDSLALQSGLYNTLSVDRIDSSKGYIKDNVCLVTWRVNNCKQDLSLKDFHDLCKKVLEHGTH
jgi:CRISPR/Cas system Type II protein with McrA/HNH and RuvC-like nuclease domain